MNKKEQIMHEVSLIEKVVDMLNSFDSKDDFDDLSINSNDTTVYDKNTEGFVVNSTVYYDKEYIYKNAFKLCITYTTYRYDTYIERILLFPDIKNNKEFCYCITSLLYCYIDGKVKNNLHNKIITLLNIEEKREYLMVMDKKLEENLLNTIDEYYKSKKEK